MGNQTAKYHNVATDVLEKNIEFVDEHLNQCICIVLIHVGHYYRYNVRILNGNRVITTRARPRFYFLFRNGEFKKVREYVYGIRNSRNVWKNHEINKLIKFVD